MLFRNRWRIEGLLTTLTCLHIGSGETTTRSALKDGEQPVQIETVATDINGRAYIPASTIKGNVRSWLQDKFDDKVVEQIFGSRDTKKKDAVGGKAEFWNAYAVNTPAFDYEPPFWDDRRLTGVAASVAIDRQTGTSVKKKLFHFEFIPPGVSFKIVVTGQDFEDSKEYPENEILPLLCAFEDGFNKSPFITFGASAGNGGGRLRWSLTDIRKMDCEGVLKWIKSDFSPIGYDALESITSEERSSLEEKARILLYAPKEKQNILLTVILHFDRNFLINDPSQTKKTAPQEIDENKLYDHAPLVDIFGEIILPASSIRGAFRSQAEKILRTIKGSEAACYQTSLETQRACEQVGSIEDIESLCPACLVFGTPGWRSPVEFSDFIAIDNGSETTQQFVAIDRFTGGGAEGYKFDAKSSYRPTLRGTIGVDMERLAKANAEAWGLGLVALTIRDLLEGDITLGFGSSKGYGACRAEINDDELKALQDKIPHDWIEQLERHMEQMGKGVMP
jgi:CRISPR/Cas system CSM-associated protein Csm3 (group 7 of RAMP superfamily)